MNVSVSLLMLSILLLPVSVPIDDSTGLMELSAILPPLIVIRPLPLPLMPLYGVFLVDFTKPDEITISSFSFNSEVIKASSQLLSSLANSIESEDSSNSLGEDMFLQNKSKLEREYMHI